MQKIEALRKTIYNLENDVYEYSWTNHDKCNCGVLARTILGGETPQEAGFLRADRREGYSPWAGQAYCMTTGMGLPKLFRALIDAGFTHEDICHLENLSNPVLCARLGWRLYTLSDQHICPVSDYRTQKESVIVYLKAWVQLLEEETIGEQPVKETPPAIIENKTQIQYIQKVVQVPSTLNEQVKQVIQIAEATS